MRVRRSSSILGCSCAHRRHVQSNQQDGRSICGLHGDEGVGYENELSKVGQSRVRAYQTVPRLQDRTAQRHQRRFWGRVVQGARCRYEIFGARSSDVLREEDAEGCAIQLSEHCSDIQQIVDRISFTFALVFHFYHKNIRLSLVSFF